MPTGLLLLLGRCGFVFPLVALAWLAYPSKDAAVRRQRKLLRRAIAPIAFWAGLQVPLSFPFEPRTGILHFLLAILGVTASFTGLAWGFCDEEIRWIGYLDPPLVDYETKHASLLDRIKWTVSLVSSPRGLGFSTGCRPNQLPKSLPEPPVAFLSTWLKQYTILQALLHVSLWLLSGSYHNSGDSLGFLAQKLGKVKSGHEYLDALAFALHTLCAGQAVWLGIELGTGIVMLAMFLVLRLARFLTASLPASLRPNPFEPHVWPPLFRSPYGTTGLADFWAYRWHQIYRRIFTLAGRTAKAICGKGALGQAASVFAVFAVSGFIHEWPVQTLDPSYPVDPLSQWNSIKFFMLQAVGILAEQALRAYYKPSRSVGLAYTLGYLLLTGHFLTGSLLSRGLPNVLLPTQHWTVCHWLVPYGPVLLGKDACR
ncbi:uncharacterized protein L969DRAFT_77362 [Mixia osmundae IAM 14324]|uniref:Wax synthase domain-containing protein n=1 Tax=Mixia osmundae (strain CBS 9802 / IAM 14324 / JCM 22182 / KY 12970) TaxID=764103 RepID=G7DX18_MIXOS|nr:uncharacterized protein L969DRAFT_77362 [Mixia osmundae IAM 14324]KEI38076.1 hypothetical protein L969DRAFT_77362 [Mixia osmundae IAM 14324]GAA95115.1 hypothetical protein E5Q_01770 [Mixia osmundae IAM 14324]